MKWIEYSAHGVFWIATAWLLTSSFSIQGQEILVIDGVKTVKTVRDSNLAQQILVCILVSALVGYLNFLNIRQLKKIGKTRVLLFTSILFLLSILIYYLLEKLFFTHYLLLPNQISTGILIFYFAISSTYALVKVLIQTEQKQKDLILAAKQAELNLLRNQLQPHFLFNALNNLLSMVDQKKSPKLSDSIEKLSQLLRYVIKETQSNKTTIQKEIEFIKNYCDLQALRFEEDELKLIFEVIGANNYQLVEPGLFIPFVENAIKFGAEPEKSSSIKIHFDLSQPETIKFSVLNKNLSAMRKNESTGTGISAIKERLHIVYPKKHELKIVQDKNFIVNLKIHTN